MCIRDSPTEAFFSSNVSIKDGILSAPQAQVFAYINKNCIYLYLRCVQPAIHLSCWHVATEEGLQWVAETFIRKYEPSFKQSTMPNSLVVFNFHKIYFLKFHFQVFFLMVESIKVYNAPVSQIAGPT